MKNVLLFAWLVVTGLLAGNTAQGQNLALGKTTSASSNNQPSANAVDNNGTTRWESASTDPQWMAVDLGSVQTIDRVRLTWENAYGKDFTIQVSNNGTSWTTVATTTNNATTINEYTSLGATGRYVRMYGTARATSYGYSIFEIEVYNSTPSPGSNVALSKPGTASSAEGSFVASKAFDGSNATRWGSNHNNNEWLYVDLGASANITQVTLVWESAYGKDFHIDLSSNGTSWTTATTITNNTLHFNDIAVVGTARYVRMYGVTRGTGYGFSLYEMRVYGTFPTPLPVTLTRFSATAASQAVNLSWATASEKNNQGFEIQRSANGREFAKLGTVAGAGNSATPRSYGYRDAAPLAGTSYYRLQQTDLDGTVSYGPVAAVKMAVSAAITTCEVFPNPATDRVTVTCTAAPTAWTLTNSNGQVVRTGTLAELASASSFPLDLSSCQAGVYVISLLSNGQPVQRARVVKAL